MPLNVRPKDIPPLLHKAERLQARHGAFVNMVRADVSFIGNLN
jgi:hypothetical protein